MFVVSFSMFYCLCFIIHNIIFQGGKKHGHGNKTTESESKSNGETTENIDSIPLVDSVGDSLDGRDDIENQVLSTNVDTVNAPKTTIDTTLSLELKEIRERLNLTHDGKPMKDVSTTATTTTTTASSLSLSAPSSQEKDLIDLEPNMIEFEAVAISPKVAR